MPLPVILEQVLRRQQTLRMVEKPETPVSLMDILFSFLRVPTLCVPWERLIYFLASGCIYCNNIPKAAFLTVRKPPKKYSQKSSQQCPTELPMGSRSPCYSGHKNDEKTQARQKPERTKVRLLLMRKIDNCSRDQSREICQKRSCKFLHSKSVLIHCIPNSRATSRKNGHK